MIGRGHIVNIPRRKSASVVGRSLRGLLRLVLPVMLLLTVGAACVVYSDIPVEGLGTFAGRPVTLGLALVPLTFFVIHLTNRRYGATYAFAQVLLAWGLALVAIPALLPAITPAMDLRTLAGFAAGLFVSQLVAIVLFDGTRGPTWWKAPLVASVAGGIVLCVVAFPAAFAGTSPGWVGEMVNYLALALGAAVLLLVPYGLMRSLVPPRPGFGGY
jgi:uncharacterized PurR-regulated membrane protein YhhQ (DUF165 family)